MKQYQIWTKNEETSFYASLERPARSSVEIVRFQGVLRGVTVQAKAQNLIPFFLNLTTLLIKLYIKRFIYLNVRNNLTSTGNLCRIMGPDLDKIAQDFLDRQPVEEICGPDGMLRYITNTQGATLCAYFWPVTRPRGIIQLIHGHARRVTRWSPTES